MSIDAVLYASILTAMLVATALRPFPSPDNDPWPELTTLLRIFWLVPIPVIWAILFLLR